MFTAAQIDRREGVKFIFERLNVFGAQLRVHHGQDSQRADRLRCCRCGYGGRTGGHLHVEDVDRFDGIAQTGVRFAGRISFQGLEICS